MCLLLEFTPMDILLPTRRIKGQLDCVKAPRPHAIVQDAPESGWLPRHTGFARLLPRGSLGIQDWTFAQVRFRCAQSPSSKESLVLARHRFPKVKRKLGPGEAESCKIMKWKSTQKEWGSKILMQQGVTTRQEAEQRVTPEGMHGRI